MSWVQISSQPRCFFLCMWHLFTGLGACRDIALVIGSTKNVNSAFSTQMNKTAKSVLRQGGILTRTYLWKSCEGNGKGLISKI